MASKRSIINQGRAQRQKHDFHCDEKSAEGIEFRFVVHRNRVDVDILTDPRNKERRYNFDWQTALSDEQKLRVFAVILDEYRKHSIGDEHGYRGAALGISNGRIFLGANTPTGQLASSYFKDCAEQNMVNAAADLLAYEQVRNAGWDTKRRPAAPEFDALYMMGGVNKDKIPISCPCGKCTDMLAKNMKDGGAIYALPILDGIQPSDLKTPNFMRINSDAVTLADIKAADAADIEAGKKHYTAWKTTINHLNIDREVSLLEPTARVQQQTFTKFCESLTKVNALAEENAHATHIRAVQLHTDSKKAPIQTMWQLFTAMLAAAMTEAHGLSKRALRILGIEEKNTVVIAAANQFLARTSIPELDAATTNGQPDLQAMTRFMYNELRQTAVSRIRGDIAANQGTDKKRTYGKAWVRKSLPLMRCVVVQLDDGTYRHAIEAAGDFDTSMPHAESAIAAHAMTSFGRYGVRHVWAMEMNPNAIDRGVLPTSPKEGIERLVKRASDAGLDFRFIPFSTGETSVPTRDFTEKALFPALFRGSRPLEAPRMKPPEAWTDFINTRSNMGTSIQLGS